LPFGTRQMTDSTGTDLSFKTCHDYTKAYNFDKPRLERYCGEDAPKCRGKMIGKTLIPSIAILVLAAGNVLAQDTVEEPVAALEHAQTLSRAFRSSAAKVAPAVVTVVTQVSKIHRYADGFETYERRVLEDGSIGSGVIIHESGVVLTNSHVLENAEAIVVRTGDDREYRTTDVRRDPRSDVAILRLENPPKDIPVARLGDSNTVDIGDWVIAIGSPFELEATVSAGIISGKNRKLEKIRRGKLLQTDAAINPGNSGGPLVNIKGEVIGINTAIASSSGGYQGIGFAIPINNARWVINQLAAYGQVKRGYLGVKVEEHLPRLAEKNDLPAVAGVVIVKVHDESPASRAGLRTDDLIVEFAGKRIRDTRDLQGAVERKKAGSKHSIRFIRNGEPVEAEIEVVLSKN
ncbi:MAG: trypsin-like peptidase domain-containing protein, partial [Planctomycetota bacterium]